MTENELKKFLLEKIAHEERSMKEYGGGPFLGGKSVGVISLAQEILNLLSKEKDLTNNK